MNTNNEAIKKTKLVIDALDYAHTHNLDIHAEEDAQKLLDAIDPEHSFQDDVQEFMKLIQAANVFIEKDVKQRRSVN